MHITRIILEAHGAHHSSQVPSGRPYTPLVSPLLVAAMPVHIQCTRHARLEATISVKKKSLTKILNRGSCWTATLSSIALRRPHTSSKNKTSKAECMSCPSIAPSPVVRSEGKMLWSLVWKTYCWVTVIASLLCFVAYGWDKLQASHGKRRVPESTLHRLELIGGWPGALLAQRCFRHKTRKSKYQLSFRMAIAIHVMSLLLCWLLLS